MGQSLKNSRLWSCETSTLSSSESPVIQIIEWPLTIWNLSSCGLRIYLPKLPEFASQLLARIPPLAKAVMSAGDTETSSGFEE